MEQDVINEIRFKVLPPDGMEQEIAVDPVRTIYTLMELPQAHTALEKKFAPRKITVVSYNKKRFLPQIINE